MARGDGGAGVEPAIGDGEVDHLGRGEPDLGDAGSGGDGAAAERVGHAGGREPDVVSHGDPRIGDTGSGLSDDLDECAADRLAAGLIDLVRVHAANVVRLEDPWCQCHSVNPCLNSS